MYNRIVRRSSESIDHGTGTNTVRLSLTVSLANFPLVRITYLSLKVIHLKSILISIVVNLTNARQGTYTLQITV